MVFHSLSSEQHRGSHVLSQVGPARILGFNQSELLPSGPALQLFPPPNGLVNVLEALVVHQPIAMILAGKSLDLASLVLKGAPVDAVGHADIQSPRTTANNVGEIPMLPHNLDPRSS